MFLPARRFRTPRVFGGASRTSVAEGGGALWRARPKAAAPQRALRYRKVLRACSKSERVAYFCGADDSSSSSLLASMDELAAPCPEDSRGSASGLGSEQSLIGRPAKPEADKQRSKSWRCTLEAPSEVQQSRLREAGMDRCTSKLHTVATLAEGRGCTSSLHVQRFAMDISSDAGTEFLRAFFVFSIPVRRGQLEQRSR